MGPEQRFAGVFSCILECYFLLENSIKMNCVATLGNESDCGSVRTMFSLFHIIIYYCAQLHMKFFSVLAYMQTGSWLLGFSNGKLQGASIWIRTMVVEREGFNFLFPQCSNLDWGSMVVCIQLSNQISILKEVLKSPHAITPIWIRTSLFSFQKTSMQTPN